MLGTLQRAGRAPQWHKLAIFIIACLLYFAGKSPFAGQWDSFDYLKQAVVHQPSPLGFGRPAFMAYNIALWEVMRRIFGLTPLDVEVVVLAGIILLGGIGVLVFRHLAAQMMPSPAWQLATLGMLLSPAYALYSGYVMTEVPMLVAALGAASLLWSSAPRHAIPRALTAGLLFGVAVGMREQALTLAGAYVWIIWVRRLDQRSRVRALICFGIAASVAVLGPVLAMYLWDPSGFVGRVTAYLHAVPTGRADFLKNIEASLLYALAISPAAWLAVFGAACWRAIRRPRQRTRDRTEVSRCTAHDGPPREIPRPIWGFFLCLALPLVVLWRDADVQIQPRYTLIVLPASLILCASLYRRWASSARAAVAWAVLHLVVFATAQLGLQPFRALQQEKKEYARLVRESIPGPGLLAAGAYSPVFDYYRAIGVRPQWRILWSGWGWDRKGVEAELHDSWTRGAPVYLCDGPAAWLFFEDQRLGMEFLFKHSKKEVVAPRLVRVYAPGTAP